MVSHFSRGLTDLFRVKDVDFATGEIIVRRGKGAKDRVTTALASL